jgi:hypothetical protein
VLNKSRNTVPVRHAQPFEAFSGIGVSRLLTLAQAYTRYNSAQLSGLKVDGSKKVAGSAVVKIVVHVRARAEF